MIANEYQYRLTRRQADRFEQAIRDVEREAIPPNAYPSLRQAELAALRSQLESLKVDLTEYEALKSGRRRRFATNSFDDLPRMLVQARIAAGLTQKELAGRLGLKEQQIQRYEATGYSAASLKRIAEVIDALGLITRQELKLR